MRIIKAVFSALWLFFKKLWHDPVWSKIIAVALVAAYATYFLNLWQLIGKFFSSALDIAAAKTSIPNWLLTLLWLFSFSFLSWLAIKFWQHFFSSNIPKGCVEILHILANGERSAEELSDFCHTHVEKTRHYIDILLKKNMIGSRRVHGYDIIESGRSRAHSRMNYNVVESGRKFLVDLGDL